MNRLNDKVAIITGAAQGMGAAHARRFVAEGARTVFTDINESAGTTLAEELGANALFIKHDVASDADWQMVVEKAERHFGPVNALVNNAGIIGPVNKAADLSEADFLKVCAINQTSVFLGIKHVVPSMIRAGGGAIHRLRQ